MFWLSGSILMMLGSNVRGAQFTEDMDRKAEGWIPVARCRADCLNTYGRYFGATTVDTCTSEHPCFRCWNDCACTYFKPKKPWDVCAAPEKCDKESGCRRARDFIDRLRNSDTESASSGSEWTVNGSATMTSDSLMFVNATPVTTASGARYAKPMHLVFSLSYRKDSVWLQVAQETLATFDVKIALAPECRDGCDLRVVVVNSSSTLADAEFRYRAPKHYPLRSELIPAVDSTISGKFMWNDSLAGAPLGDHYLLTWNRTSRYGLWVSANASEDFGKVLIPLEAFYVFPKLKYNSFYDISVSFNTVRHAARYEAKQFQTPDCADPDPTLFVCGDVAGAESYVQNKVVTSAVVASVVAACIFTVIAVGLLVWLRRRRAHLNSLSRFSSRAGLHMVDNSSYLRHHVRV